MGKTIMSLRNGKTVQFDSVLDKNGKAIGASDEVDVPAGAIYSLPLHEFRGRVVEVFPNTGMVCVADQDDDCYDMEASNVTIVEATNG